MVKWSGKVLDLALPVNLTFCSHLPDLDRVYFLSMLAVLSLATQALIGTEESPAQ